MTMRISQGGMSAQKTNLTYSFLFIFCSLPWLIITDWILLQGEYHLLLVFFFFVVDEIVTHFCNCSQSTEILNKYFKALYFISFSPDSFCCFYKQNHTSFDLTFTSVKWDNTGLGTQVYKARLILFNLFICCWKGKHVKY